MIGGSSRNCFVAQRPTSVPPASSSDPGAAASAAANSSRLRGAWNPGRRSASGDSSPSTTVHAPQSPSAHPSLVPVRPARLRRYSSTVVAGGTSETQMSSPSSMNRVACVSGRTLLTTRGSRSGCASATAVSGIAPWRYQERHVIVLLRACDPECNDYDVDERWLGQLQPP